MPQDIKVVALYPQTKFNTLVSVFEDSFNIVEAFRVYHYGVSSVSGSVSNPSSSSIESHFRTITASAASLNNINKPAFFVQSQSPFNVVNKDSSLSNLENASLWIDTTAETFFDVNESTVALTVSAPYSPVNGMVWIDRDFYTTASIALNNYLTNIQIPMILSASPLVLNTLISASGSIVELTSKNIISYSPSAAFMSIAGTQDITNKTYLNSTIVNSTINVQSLNSSSVVSNRVSASVVSTPQVISSSINANQVTSLSSVSSSISSINIVSASTISTQSISQLITASTAIVAGNQDISSFRIRNILMSTTSVTGGNDGDIYITYIA